MDGWRVDIAILEPSSITTSRGLQSQLQKNEKRLLQQPNCVFRRSVTDRFGIVTAEFGSVTGHFGDVTEGRLVAA